MKNKIKSKRLKKPWPTKEAMEQVYAMNLWGGEHATFYSGVGSHAPEIINPYITAMISFLTSFRIPLVVCDLGCGDFNVGKQLVHYTQRYVAVDIVKDLIEHNRTKFKGANLEFRCLNIAVDRLPAGDCAVVRQVLQHLSNQEIQQIANKLVDFKYVIITEHVPHMDFVPNKDIISGQGTRLKNQSGVDLLAPPFNFRAKAQKQLVSVIPKEHDGIITTMLYRMF